MKIAVIGIDFPLGKRNLADERMERLKDIFHVPKVTYIQLEFLEAGQLKEADSIVCEEGAKLDLLVGDLEIIEGQLNNAENKELFARAKEALEKEVMLNEVPFSAEEKKTLSNFNLVSLKTVYLVNKDNLPAQPELIKNAFSGAGMIAFFTANDRELRAWPVAKGTTVFEAAGSIHSDIQRGFIKAEVVSYEDLVKSGGLNQAKAKGLVKAEDKGYLVRDGDLIQIRFNV